MTAKGDKEKEGKLRYDLIPPRGLEELAKVYTEGANKYADRNWEQGIAWSDCYASLMRHMQEWRQGSQRHERGMHHLASVAFWAFALMEFEETFPELNNLPGSVNYKQPFNKEFDVPEDYAFDSRALLNQCTNCTCSRPPIPWKDGTGKAYKPVPQDYPDELFYTWGWNDIGGEA